jgi:PEP-CTERM motif
MASKLRFRKITSSLIGAAALFTATSSAQAALVFNFTFVAGTSAQAQAGFNAAAARWSNLFTDNVTLNMTVGQISLGAGILAQAGSSDTSYSYSAFKAALASDVTSAADATAVANLVAGPSFGMMINRTLDNPNGPGSATPYLDTAGANNQTITISNSNAKALGLATVASNAFGLCASACDAGIQFGTAFAWDYDPSDGITAGAYDFVGIATHEIGHALGFTSGVDVLDYNSTGTFYNANEFEFVNSLDLFRYSALSAGTAGGVIDFSADNRTKYFSIDRGVTNLGASFSTGQTWGDGRQASHWKDNLGLGVMDPTAGQGELLSISANDRLALDVIGWNLRTAVPAVPEPGTWMMMLAGFGLVGAAHRRRRSSVASLA